MNRKLLWALGAMLLAVAAALVWLHNNLDERVKAAIEQYGSQACGAAVRLDQVAIAAADGRGVLRGLSIGNPQGFQTAHALQVSVVDLAVDLSTLASDVVVVHNVELETPDVIYEKGRGGTNFDALQANVQQFVGADGASSAQRSAKPAKRLIVEHFAIHGTRAQASAAFMQGKTVAFKLPDIDLKDIGKAEGGITPAQLGTIVMRALNQKVRAAVSIDALTQSASDGVGKAGDALKHLFK